MTNELKKEQIAALFTQAVSFHREEQFEKAFELLTNLAEQGIDSAQNYLAFYYQKGLGTTQDYEQALYWYLKAAEQGELYAQNNLGLLYEKGEGIPQNYDEAIHWFTKAALQGHSEAQFNLAVMYDTGKGVKQDFEVAAHWLCQAAEQNHAIACYYLGDYFESGLCVLTDYRLAGYWYNKALKLGVTDAEEALQRSQEKRQKIHHVDFQADVVPNSVRLDKEEQTTSIPKNAKPQKYYDWVNKIVMARMLFSLRSKNIRIREKHYPTTPEQTRLLTLGAPLFCKNLETCRSFKVVNSKQSVKEMLSSWWGIENRDDALSTLFALSTAEHHTLFADDVYNTFVLPHISNVVPNSVRLDSEIDTTSCQVKIADLINSSELDNAIYTTINRIFTPDKMLLLTNQELQDKFWNIVMTQLAERINEALSCYKIAKDMLISLGYTETELSKIKSTAAWDFGRTAIVARYCAVVEYINEEEAWTFMEDALKLAQNIYSDWKQYLAGYIFGRALGYNSDSIDSYPAVRYLLSHKNSPFKDVELN